MRYAFIEAHRAEFSVRSLCRVLMVHFSGFYLTRNAARRDVFEYIEMYYNPTRKHTNNDMLSPVDYEARELKLNNAGVSETRGTSGIAYKKHTTKPEKSAISIFLTTIELLRLPVLTIRQARFYWPSSRFWGEKRLKPRECLADLVGLVFRTFTPSAEAELDRNFCCRINDLWVSFGAALKHLQRAI